MHDGVEIHMGPTEYRLLEFFMSHAGRSYRDVKGVSICPWTDGSRAIQEQLPRSRNLAENAEALCAIC